MRRGNLVQTVTAFAVMVIPVVTLVMPASAATRIAVTTPDDVTAVDGRCSLREAIAAATTDAPVGGCAAGAPGTDVIGLPAGHYRLKDALSVTTGIVLRGAGAGRTVLDAGGRPRVLWVRDGASTALWDLTITGARDGSALRNNGRLDASRVEFRGNSFANDFSGSGASGLDNFGRADLRQIDAHDNASTVYGPGVLNNEPGAFLRVTESSFHHNSGEGSSSGLAIYSGGTLELSDSSFTENRGDYAFEHVRADVIDLHAGHARLRDVAIEANQAVGLGNGGRTDARRLWIRNNEDTGLVNQGTMDLRDSSIDSNGNPSGYFQSDAGGVVDTGVLRVDRVSVVRNRGNTGGLSLRGLAPEVSLRNTTVAGNVADALYVTDFVNLDAAGGIAALRGTLSLDNVTVAGNSATWCVHCGSAVVAAGVVVRGASDSVHLANSILSGNRAREPGINTDCAGPVTLRGYNLIGEDSCSLGGNRVGLMVGRDAQLGPLRNGAAGLPVMQPARSSPAIDSANPANPGGDAGPGTRSCSEYDEQVRRRPSDGDGDGIARCDLGAVERGFSAGS